MYRKIYSHANSIRVMMMMMMNGQIRRDGSAPLSRYPITGVQTHARTFFFRHFPIFFVLLFFWFFGSFGFLFSRTPC